MIPIEIVIIERFCVKKQLLLASLFTISAATSFAADNNSFSIPATNQLDVKFLDSAWSSRENLTNQKSIANYLLTNPIVPQDYEAAWKTARLVYFIGNYGYGEKSILKTADGVKLFDYGVSAAKIAIDLKPTAVEGQYWYAVDLGSYGLAKGVMASAKGAGPGMDALKKAIAIDPSYQNYGSSRILGRYYQELPGLMGGSNKKALALLMTATDNAPQFKNNWVFLGQYYLSVDEYQKALDSCQKALTLPSADGKYEDLRYTREATECVSTAQNKLAK